MYSYSGEKVPGFPSSVIPTLEEKLVSEQRSQEPTADSPIPEVSEEDDDSTGQRDGNLPNQNQDAHGNESTVPNGHSKGGQSSANGHVEQNNSARQHEPSQARTTNGELYGAPADASIDPQHDDQPPHARSGKVDAN